MPIEQNVPEAIVGEFMPRMDTIEEWRDNCDYPHGEGRYSLRSRISNYFTSLVRMDSNCVEVAERLFNNNDVVDAEYFELDDVKLIGSTYS